MGRQKTTGGKRKTRMHEDKAELCLLKLYLGKFEKVKELSIFLWKMTENRPLVLFIK